MDRISFKLKSILEYQENMFKASNPIKRRKDVLSAINVEPSSDSLFTAKPSSAGKRGKSLLSVEGHNDACKVNKYMAKVSKKEV